HLSRLLGLHGERCRQNVEDNATDERPPIHHRTATLTKGEPTILRPRPSGEPVMKMRDKGASSRQRWSSNVTSLTSSSIQGLPEAVNSEFHAMNAAWHGMQATIAHSRLACGIFPPADFL